MAPPGEFTTKFDVTSEKGYYVAQLFDVQSLALLIVSFKKEFDP